MTLLLAKRAVFCQILERAASNYRMLIYSGLFLLVLSGTVVEVNMFH